MRQDNLRDRVVESILRRIGQLETMNPLESAGVSKGRTRFVGNESLIVEGSQKVTGWLIVTGTLKLVGALLLEGITTITGALTAKGTTRFEGDTTQQGPFHIVGATDIQGDMRVKPGGKITIEGALPAVLEDGALSFSTGAKLKADATGAMLHAGSTQSNVRVGNGAAALQFATATVSCESDGVLITGVGVRINSPASGISITGPITAPLPLKTGATANVHIDSAGKLWRTS